ncbi:hypothetical protein ACFL4Z_02115, partial [candidate division KSB1 bacterium]
MEIIRKKYTSAISLLLCILFFGIITVSDLPYLHNLDADLNIGYEKNVIVLEGRHNHENNPKSACFDFHKIKIVKVGECLICNIFNNFSFVFSFLTTNFDYKPDSSSIYSKLSSPFLSNIFNISFPRAPPSI